MSKKQGFSGKVANAAFHGNAIKNIITAFMQGGFVSGAIKVAKYYWPYVLTAVIFLLLLPVIIFTCLPMMLFGFSGSTDPQITELTVQAQTVGGYIDNYEQYYEERIEQIKEETERYIDKGYSLVESGEKIPHNWLVALFSVSVQNDLTVVNEQQIKDFVNDCITYEVVTLETGVPDPIKRTVTIDYLSPDEIMEKRNYSDNDKNWATLIFNTLEGEETDGNDSIYPD